MSLVSFIRSAGNAALLFAVFVFGSSSAASARSPATDAQGGMSAFAGNCFSPFLTAEKASDVFNLANVRYDFYDLNPFSDVAPSAPSGRAVTPGTDRRCEVSFDSDFAMQALHFAVTALGDEGIKTPTDLPAGYEETSGTVLLAARKLNPRRIAVVHVGTRPGENGTIETFMSVERLLPSDQ